MNLNIMNSFPEKLATCPIQQVHEVLGGPTLIKLIKSDQLPVLFFSILLHGNEDSSFSMLQHLLRNLETYHCNFILFIGNTKAAAEKLRKLPDQPDFNRIWNGLKLPEEIMAQQVLQELKKYKITAAIDVHNTIGENPFYACLNKLDCATLNLAACFSKDIIFFTEPREVLSIQLTALCPAIVIECGKTGKDEGATKAIAFLEDLACNIGTLLNQHNDSYVYESYAILRLSCDNLKVNPAIEKLNFLTTQDDSLIAETSQNLADVFWTNHPDGLDQFLFKTNGKVYLRKGLTPMMLTLNKQIMKEDCFCYFLRRIEIS